MWTISELKAQGKNSFYANRWPLVIVSLLFAVISGGTSRDVLKVNVDQGIDVKLGGFTVFSSTNVPVWATIILFVALALAAAAIVVNIFILAPLKVGCYRYFIESMDAPADFSCVLQNFYEGYINTVITMFTTDLRIVLWTFVLIVPGVIKAYDYRLVPYLLAEYPDMPAEEARRRSTELMMGDKVNSFILDLSFLGWNILSALTFGLVGLFFSNPYQQMTNAFFYRTMCEKQYYN